MRLSVVIPFFNLERYVRSCIDSVVVAAARAGGGFELEMLCVDDGSSDGTPLLLDELASDVCQRFPTVGMRVLRKKNGGEGSARNAGLAVATGDWVTFLDGDDVWLENLLEVAVPLLKANDCAEIVALKYGSFDDGDNPPLSTTADAKVFDTEKVIPSEVLLNVGVFPTFFRRAFLSEARFSALPLGADRLFVAQALARAGHIVMCDAVVQGYRLRAGSMARAVWNARKVISQCDYAFGSLCALAASGKTLGGEGQTYLASLWLSDVPNRALRLDPVARFEVAESWAKTLSDRCAVAALPRMDWARWVLEVIARRMPVGAMRIAWLLRKAGLV